MRDSSGARAGGSSAGAGSSAGGSGSFIKKAPLKEEEPTSEDASLIEALNSGNY